MKPQINLNDLKSAGIHTASENVNIDNMTTVDPSKIIPSTKNEDRKTTEEGMKSIIDDVKAASDRYVGNLISEKEKALNELAKDKETKTTTQPIAESKLPDDEEDEKEFEEFEESQSSDNNFNEVIDNEEKEKNEMAKEEKEKVTSNAAEAIKELTSNSTKSMSNESKISEDTEEEKSLTESIDIDDNDFADILDEEEKEEKDDSDALIKMVSDKFDTVKETVDLSSIKISDNPITANSILQFRRKAKSTKDWLLTEANKVVSLEAFSGDELEKLDTRGNSRNRYNQYMETFRIILSHIPQLKDTNTIDWLKSLKFFDLNNLWFGVYKAALEKGNIIPYSCGNKKCGKRFLKDVPIMDMVKFKDDKAKQDFLEAMENADSLVSPTYEVYKKQIADDIIIYFRDPSVWNVVFENLLLSDKLRVKYASILNAIAFIDKIVFKNPTTGQYQELVYKRFPNEDRKDIKSKVYTYGKVLTDLSRIERLKVDKYVNELGENHNKITYQIPEAICPDCGTVIEAIPSTAEDLLFMYLDLTRMILL